MFASIEVLVFCTSLIVTILIIWFKSNAFVEYLDLLNFKKLFYIKEFKEQDPLMAIDYPNFLLTQKNCFLSKLLSCPTCVSFWLSLSCCVEVGFFNLPLIYLSSLMLFRAFDKLDNPL